MWQRTESRSSDKRNRFDRHLGAAQRSPVSASSDPTMSNNYSSPDDRSVIQMNSLFLMNIIYASKQSTFENERTNTRFMCQTSIFESQAWSVTKGKMGDGQWRMEAKLTNRIHEVDSRQSRKGRDMDSRGWTLSDHWIHETDSFKLPLQQWDCWADPTSISFKRASKTYLNCATWNIWIHIHTESPQKIVQTIVDSLSIASDSSSFTTDRTSWVMSTRFVSSESTCRRILNSSSSKEKTHGLAKRCCRLLKSAPIGSCNKMIAIIIIAPL